MYKKLGKLLAGNPLNTNKGTKEVQLTKHRDTFTLTMSSEELLFLVNNLGSDPQSTEDQEKVTECLRELISLLPEEQY